MVKKFYIRADASPVIGTGHFVRCLNLAKSLIKRDAEVTFISRNLGVDLNKRLVAAGSRVINLPFQNRLSSQSPYDYGTWLGVTERDDISQCLNLIDDVDALSIIVDHYGINEEWLSLAKKSCSKLIVLDDLAERKLDVDIVINQNVGWSSSDYAHLVGQETNLLIGPQYALISEKYAFARRNLVRDFTNSAQLRILVSLGGADNENISGKVMRVLEKMQTKHDFVVTIVVGAMNPNSKELTEISQRSDGKIVLIQGANNLVDACLSHDIAIGAVGGSSWERCCLGLPTILVPIAANQKPAAKMLQKVGAGFLVDCFNDNFEHDLAQALRRMSDEETRSTMSKQALRICDGLGSERVASEIMFGHQ